MRNVIHWIGTAAHTARLLWTVRAAIPWPIRALLALAMAVKCLPLDFGVDETLTVIAAIALHHFRPGLMRACWQGAKIRA